MICNLETEDEQSAMPFEKSPETLTRLVSAAVGGSQQISEALDEVGYDVTELQQDIAKQRDRILEVAANEIRKYETDENALVAAEKEFKEKLQDAPRQNERVSLLITIIYGAILLICTLYFIGLFGYGLYYLVIYWRSSLKALSILNTWGSITAYTAPLIVLIASLALMNRLKVARDNKLNKRKGEWSSAQEDLAQKFGLPDIKASLDKQRGQIDKLLSERVRQEILSSINRRMEPSYSPQLQVVRPRGFGEVFDRRFAI